MSHNEQESMDVSLVLQLVVHSPLTRFVVLDKYEQMNSYILCIGNGSASRVDCLVIRLSRMDLITQFL